MRKFLKPLVFLLLTLLSLAPIVLSCVRFMNETGDYMYICYDASSSEKPMTVDETERLVERIDTIASASRTLSYCAELPAAEIKGERVDPVLVNNLFFDNYRIPVDSFDENSAVISRELALKLFFSYDVTGRQIEISGETYTISGLYDRADDLIGRYLLDNKERVFVGSAKNGDKAYVTEMCIENGSQSAATLEQMGLKNYCYTDFSEKRQVIGGLTRVSFLLLYVVLLFAVLIFYIKKISSAITAYRLGIKSSYPLEYVRENKIKTALFALFVIAVPAALIAIPFFVDFSIYIIPDYIPYDNLFDIPHYIDTHIKAVQELNARALTGDLYRLRMYDFSFKLISAFNILTVVFAVLTARFFRKR